ncbi:MAG: hypothetical protein IPM53_02895 [Anaerolineaceae bacterium]|nr:hypothetical protein [Anaerolineaceae bacterium]
MAEQKKILVLESEKLLAASIVNLLASRPEYDVLQTTVSSLLCLDQPGSPQPDIVILEKEVLAANISAVVKVTDRYPKLRLIVFSLSDPKVHIFDQQTVQVRNASDFLELL